MLTTNMSTLIVTKFKNYETFTFSVSSFTQHQLPFY